MPTKPKRKPPASKPVQKTEPASTGKPPEKSPHWVSLDALCRAWVHGEEFMTGKTGLLAKYAACFKTRSRMSSYESACWGSLRDLKMFDASRNLQVMVLDQKLPLRFSNGAHEIYLGFTGSVDVAVKRAAAVVSIADGAISSLRKAVSGQGPSAPAKVGKAPRPRAAARTGRSNRGSRG
jgi:hypothetical protein